MPNPDQPQSILGAIIRRQREMAELPMRQLAAAVGISNPYLSQIERGLRAPSDAVLSAIAKSLHLSTDELFAEAGFVKPRPEDAAEDTDSVLAALAESTRLTPAQRRSMTEVYKAFLDANAVRRSRDAPSEK